jgi:glycosyltransferase involved in cell wall biosynthesis
LNRSDADVFHLHWIGNEMMSVADVARLRGPVVWTLHDMWAFCGAEHYAEGFRWRDGYSRNNREEGESGFDLNRWVWSRKMKHWREPINIVAPSRWMADCARQSMLMRDWPITVIPNAIDTDVWRPVEKICARTILGLPSDTPLLLFGASGGTEDARKGFDLLRSALQLLHGRVKGLELVVLGQPTPKVPLELGLPVHFTGHLHDEVSLRLYYSAADAFVLPSRQDNLPNVGLEAEACGTPVVAFRVGGMPDIVDHQTTGYLAEAFDVQDLAWGIEWVLDGAERRMDLSARSRQTAVARFSYPSVARRYMELYESILQSRPDAG